MMDQNNSTIRTYMAIMAERDAAILERNMAIDERKRALAERDMAMLQRDAAIAECNAALEERDKATLKLKESSMNDDNNIVTESSNIHYQQEMHQMLAAASYDPAENFTTDPFNLTDPISETANPKKVRQSKESKLKKAPKLPKVVKREEEEESLNWQLVSTLDDWDDGNCEEFEDASDEEQDKNLDTTSWEEDLGLDQVDYDVSAMPVPVCSCTGTPQPCYKWGNGGWQSACCTTTISMYPLPQASHKRYSRVGGRKMSASAFSKLLSRLTAEGYDLSSPLDLKDHWAKHGTNRFSTMK